MRLSVHRRYGTTQVSPFVVLLMVVGVFVVVGGIFAGIGVALGRNDEKLKESCTVSVQAEVTDFMRNSDGLRSPVYKYEYNGTFHSFYNHSYTSDPVYEVGDIAELMINPDKPQEAYVPADKTERTVSVVFTAVGFGLIGLAALIGLIFGTLVLSAKKKDQKKEEPWEM